MAMRSTFTVILILLLGVGFACKSRVILPSGVPAKIKVVKGQSLNVRELPEAQSKIIGAATTNVNYNVVDAIPTYYFIRLPL